MTYEEMFDKAKELLTACDPSVIEGHVAIQVDVIGEGEGAFYIEVKDGALYVEPYEYYDHDVKLIATAENFLKIFEGTLNPVSAFTSGKLIVDGDMGKALELQKLIENHKKVVKKAEKEEKKAAKVAAKKK